MKKRMLIMLSIVSILFGAIFIYKAIGGFIFRRAMIANQSPVIVVSAMRVQYSPWQPSLKASASLRAVRGIDVTTELAGMVQKIYFTSGATVKQGTLLVQLNADSDIAQLRSLQANAALALITFNRDKAQYAIHAVSKQTLDTDEQNLKSLQAQVQQQTAIVAKKSITAPFDGRLGISQVNPGQFINPGDKIVTLETLNPIYAEFYLPQQNLAKLKVGQNVILTADAFPKKIFTGKISTIDPLIDVNTRNIPIEATIDNPNYELAPGMYTSVSVDTGEPEQYLTLPQTAVAFNPYGSLVYIIHEKNKDKNGKSVLIVKQAFVITGQTRGDQVQILQGLQEGDLIVTSGQLKLKNDSRVEINNAVVPTNNPAPNLPNEY